MLIIYTYIFREHFFKVKTIPFYAIISIHRIFCILSSVFIRVHCVYIIFKKEPIATIGWSLRRFENRKRVSKYPPMVDALRRAERRDWPVAFRPSSLRESQAVRDGGVTERLATRQAGFEKSLRVFSRNFDSPKAKLSRAGTVVGSEIGAPSARDQSTSLASRERLLILRFEIAVSSPIFSYARTNFACNRRRECRLRYA